MTRNDPFGLRIAWDIARAAVAPDIAKEETTLLDRKERAILARLNKVREEAKAEERERIAQAIEARRVHVDNTESACPDGCGWLNFAARIAREAGDPS